MALRMSVIDVPIDDSKFRAFAENFRKYSEQLAKTPGIWQQVGKAQSENVKIAQMMTASMMAQADHMREIAAAEREQQRHLTVASRLWTGIAGSARTVAGSVMHATVSLVKWAGLIGAAGGLLGMGGLYGIDRMAGEVGEQRRSAMGLGMSIGSMKAFGTDFGRVVSPESFLGGILQMRTNPALSGALWALGVNPGGSETQVALATLNALRARAKATPDSQLGLILQSLPGLQGVSIEDLERMKRMGSAEWMAQMAHFRRDRGSLNIADPTAAAWQNFSSQMQRAGQTVFKAFVQGLQPLEKPLEGLSKSFVHFLQVLMQKNGIVEHGINGLADALLKFNGTVSKPSFLKGVEEFTSDVGAMASAFHRWAEMFHMIRHPSAAVKPAEHFGSDVWWAAKNLTGWHGIAAAHGAAINNPGNLKFAGQPGATRGPGGFAVFGTAQEGLDAMARQLELYRLRGKNTLTSIIPTYAPAKDGNDVAAYIKDVAQRMHVSPTQRLHLGSEGTLAALMRAMIRHELGNNYYGGNVSRAARGATSRMGIIVQNNTGGSAVVSANGLAQ